MVGDDRIVVDAVAFFQDISILAVVDFEDAFQHIDEFFPFMCGENEIHSFFSRGDVDQERFHVASGLVLRQGMVFHVLACLAVVVAETDAVRAVVVFLAADDGSQLGLVVQEGPQANA